MNMWHKHYKNKLSNLIGHDVDLPITFTPEKLHSVTFFVISWRASMLERNVTFPWIWTAVSHYIGFNLHSHIDISAPRQNSSSKLLALTIDKPLLFVVMCAVSASYCVSNFVLSVCRGSCRQKRKPLDSCRTTSWYIQAFTIRQSSLTEEKKYAGNLGNPHIFSLLTGYFQPNTKSATFQNWVWYVKKVRRLFLEMGVSKTFPPSLKLGLLPPQNCNFCQILATRAQVV